MPVHSPLTVPDQLGLLRRSVVLRAVAIALAIVAAGPATALAAPGTLVDDTFAEFAAAPSSTTAWAVEPGAVRLRPADLSESFEAGGPALPSSLTSVPWSPGGSAVVASGALAVDGARVHPAATNETAPQAIEFRATFAGVSFQHVGFATDFNAPPHAVVSTGGIGMVPGLYARSDDGGGSLADEAIAIDPLVPHTYRIEWLETEVRYLVDGTPVRTQAIAIGSPMRPAVSDFAEGLGAISIDYLGMGAFPASGVFESRVHDAGDERSVWAGLTAASAGGTVDFETRSGDTATPDATWSAWQPLGAGDAIVSPIGRYIQYRATLGHPSGGSPTLDRVEIGYEVDGVAPDAVIDGVDVSGGTASVRFSSPAPDVVRFECGLDVPGAVSATCTSPHAFAGLASGTYTVLVRAVDAAGNEGPVAQRQFTIAEPPAGGGDGGTDTAPPGDPTPGVEPDETAPAVEVLTRRARVRGAGLVVLRVRCPREELRCRVTVRLQHGRKRSRARTVRVDGGRQVKVRLRLPAATRTLLVERRKLTLTVLVTARDAAGNADATRSRLTLRAPAP